MRPGALALSVAAMCLLGGCTEPSEPKATAVPTAIGEPTVAGPTTTAPTSVANSPLVCEPPTQAVRDWAASWSSPPPEDIAMVEVGEGSASGEQWWVVAMVSYSDAWGCDGQGCRNDVSFLTNAPSSSDARDVWIDVGRPLNSPPGTTNWSSVDWTGDRLARGQAAQAKALSCIA